MMYITGPLTMDMLEDYKWCDESNAKVEYVVEWLPLVHKYFTDDSRKALLVIYCESSGIEDAVGKNKNGTKDVGLWQFNDDTWSWLKDKLNITSKRTNAKVSTAVASWLVYNDGWHHWNASRHCWERQYNKIMSVHADGLMRKAHRQMKENFKQTGFYETNAERIKRESKLQQKQAI